MRRALPLLLLFIFLGLTGCADKPVVQARRPKVYKRIISLSPSTTEVILSNADAGSLKGRTSACNWPPNMMASIEVVADPKPNYEKIQEIKPDLIVFDKDLYSDEEIAKLKASGADEFVVDSKTVDDFVKQLYVLASMLGFETRFNDYIERIQQEEATAQSLIFNPKPKVAILLPSPGGDDYVSGTGGFLADVVKIAGGELVGGKGDKFEKLNAEQFVAANPDVILVNGTKGNLNSAQMVLDDPRFKTINAVKTKRIAALDSDVLLRRGQRVDTLIKAVHEVIAPPSK